MHWIKGSPHSGNLIESKTSYQKGSRIILVAWQIAVAAFETR